MDLVGIIEEKAWCQGLGITYDESTRTLEESSEAIPLRRLKVASGVIGDNVDSGKKVILHCLRGTGRSPTCAAAYLIQSGMSVAEAKSTVAGKRQVWSGVAAGYASTLEEFGKIIEMTRSTF